MRGLIAGLKYAEGGGSVAARAAPKVTLVGEIDFSRLERFLSNYFGMEAHIAPKDTADSGATTNRIQKEED